MINRCANHPTIFYRIPHLAWSCSATYKTGVVTTARWVHCVQHGDVVDSGDIGQTYVNHFELIIVTNKHVLLWRTIVELVS